MKNNNLIKSTIVILLIAIVALVLVSGTYAKYTTNYTATSTATVAKFSVGATVNTSTEFAGFNLFETIYEADGTSAEADVVEGKIAPGTGGKFTINLKNDSEVKVEYTLTFSETSNAANVPIEYSTDGITWETGANFSATGTLEIGSQTQQTKDVDIQWRWAYEDEQDQNKDTNDTTIGTTDPAPTVEVQAKVVFTQVD